MPTLIFQIKAIARLPFQTISKKGLEG